MAALAISQTSYQSPDRAPLAIVRAEIKMAVMVYGKPKQDVSVSGGIVHAHTRDPFLVSLPKESLEALARTYDEMLRKTD
jgi:hypothetical protein